jgi:ferredoxin
VTIVGTDVTGALKKGDKFRTTVPANYPDLYKSLQEKNLNALFNAPFWDDVQFACINCGVCTFVCPTCWCFDVQDEVRKDRGVRIRNWDACMFPLFTHHRLRAQSPGTRSCSG